MEFGKLLLKVFSADIISKIIFSLISLSLIRLMPTEEYSLYSVALTTLTLVTTIISSSFNVIYIVDKLDQKAVKATTFLSFQLFIISIAFLLLLSFKKLYDGVFLMLFLLSVAQTFLMFLQTYYQRSLLFRRYYQVEFLRVIIFFFIFLFIALHYQFISAKAVLAGQSIAVFLVFFVFGISIFSLKDFLNFSGALKIFRLVFFTEVKFLFLYFLFITIILNCDVILLSLYSNDTVVATYAAGFRYYAILQLALISVNKILLPYIQKESNYSIIESVLSKHKGIVKLFFPVIVLSIVSAQWLIPLIDGGKYPGSIAVFQVLSISSYFSLMLSPYINIVFKENGYLFLFKVAFVIAPIHIALNLSIQESMGAIGIAYLDLISFGAFNFIVFLKAKSFLAMQQVSS